MRCSFSHIRPVSKIDTGGQGRVTFFPPKEIQGFVLPEKTGFA